MGRVSLFLKHSFFQQCEQMYILLLVKKRLSKNQLLQIYQNTSNAYMSYLLKITYQHKHKKYRYHSQRPINFNQIRTQFGINQPTSSLLYIVNTNDFSFSRETINLEQQQLAFRELQLTNYLKSVTLGPKEMLKIRVISQEEKKIQQSLCDFQTETDDLLLPGKLQTMKSRSQEIDINERRKGSVTNTIQITQSFICSSLLNDAKTSKSKYLQELEQQLLRNAMRMKVSQQKRRYTKIDKIYQYLSSVR